MNGHTADYDVTRVRLAEALHPDTCGEELSWEVHKKYGGYACFTTAAGVLAAFSRLILDPNEARDIPPAEGRS
jgi:hypothetical protein